MDGISGGCWLLFILVILLIVALLIFYRQLWRWKDWARRYKEWQGIHCPCPSPDVPPPPEPGWPGGED